LGAKSRLMVTLLSGARFTISTVAHHPKHLLNMRYCVTMARRPWLGPGDILNARQVEEFARAIKPFRA
jgi:DNA polymerase (family 10)